MKRSTILLTAAAALMAVGCAKEGGSGGEHNGTLTVGIKSAKHTRAVLDATNTDPIVKAFEDNVAGFSAYVFNWDTGDLEGKATSANGDPATITGLNNASRKRVVVIANGDRANFSTASFIPQFENDPDYTRLAEGYVALSDQTFTDFTDTSKGFLMTGENAAAKQLAAGTNTIEIEVERVVSKVRLGEITFDPSVQLSDLAKFDLTDVMIQRAVSNSSLGTGVIAAPTNPAAPATAYYGGAVGSISIEADTDLSNELDLQTYLDALFVQLGYSGADDSTVDPDITLGKRMQDQSVASIDLFETPAFWYVLPNGDADKFTLLTLAGTYNGVDAFYPIEINDPDVIGNAAADGTYIKRNTIYEINLNFKNFTGIADPDVPGVAASLEVTVTPADWEGPVVQNSTWR